MLAPNYVQPRARELKGSQAEKKKKKKKKKESLMKNFSNSNFINEAWSLFIVDFFLLHYFLKLLVVCLGFMAYQPL